MNGKKLKRYRFSSLLVASPASAETPFRWILKEWGSRITCVQPTQATGRAPVDWTDRQTRQTEWILEQW